MIAWSDQLYFSSRRDNMSALIAEDIGSDPSSHIPTIEEPTVVSESSKKAMLRRYRQKLMTINARIKYREKVIKAFRKHLKHGTFPKRMKSIRPYPKMNSAEAQSIVNAACDQVQCVIVDQMIQEEEKKLSHDQDRCEALKVQRVKDLQLQTPKKPQLNTPKKPKKPTMAQLQQELADLQAKYAQLCTKLEDTQ